MAGEEMVTSTQSSRTSTPFGSISILVVDDDSTCLSIVAAILKSCKYKVVTVKHATDALCTLRIKGGSFDLVVTDVHMPDMNGFELLKQIDEEFKLPVVFMSADDKDGIILKGLQSGAAFFLVKPISAEDVKNLWQYAIAKKKGKASIEEAWNCQETAQADKSCSEDTPFNGEPCHTDKGSDEDTEFASSANERRQTPKVSKRKDPVNENRIEEGGNKGDSSTPKRAKVVWTNALHHQFLEAIRSQGLESKGYICIGAVPKKILELMNVPGLTRENVASHLQKYRIFLQRVAEASYKIQSSAERNTFQRTFRSTFAQGHPSLMYDRSRLHYAQNVEEEKIGAFFRNRYVSGQSLPMWSHDKLKQQPRDGRTARPAYQANTSGFTMQSNENLTKLSLPGNATGSLMSGRNIIEMYQQKTKVAPTSFINGQSKYNATTTRVLGHNNFICNLNLKPNYCNYNYAGYRMPGDGQLVGLGHVGGMGAEASSEFNLSNGLMNGMDHGSTSSTAPVFSGYSGDHLTQGVSSTGFQCANHISPTFRNAIQQENTSVPPLQRHSFSNGGESDQIFGLLNSVSASDSSSFLQPYSEGGLSCTFLNQTDIQSPSQQPCGEVMASNFGTVGSQYSNEYFPLFDQNLVQLGDEEFLESVFGAGVFGGESGDDNPKAL